MSTDDISEDDFSTDERVELAVILLPHLPKVEIPWEENCPICLNQFYSRLDDPDHADEGGVTQIKECGHFFCRECLAGWIRSNKWTCPVCRHDFSSVRLESPSPGSPDHAGDDASSFNVHYFQSDAYPLDTESGADVYTVDSLATHFYQDDFRRSIDDYAQSTAPMSHTPEGSTRRRSTAYSLVDDIYAYEEAYSNHWLEEGRVISNVSPTQRSWSGTSGARAPTRFSTSLRTSSIRSVSITPGSRSRQDLHSFERRAQSSGEGLGCLVA